MKTQKEKAEIFSELHKKGNPLILFNIWDAGSAKAVADAGASAIATGSWSVAAANGFTDGENLPLELALENLKRIVNAVDLPVTLDFEGGYAADHSILRGNVERVIEAGAVGINIEDQVVGGSGLLSIDEQSQRIKTIRQMAEKLKIPFFINARTDVFLKSIPDEHAVKMDEAIARAESYAKAGACGFFVPGLRNSELIKNLCGAVPLPVNIMVLADTPTNENLANLGVSRISYGPAPFIQIAETIKQQAKRIYQV